MDEPVIYNDQCGNCGESMVIHVRHDGFWYCPSDPRVQYLGKRTENPQRGQKWRKIIILEGILSEDEERAKCLLLDNGGRAYGWPDNPTADVRWERIHG